MHGIDSTDSIPEPQATELSKVTTALYGHTYFIIHGYVSIAIDLISNSSCCNDHLSHSDKAVAISIYQAFYSLVFLCWSLTIRRQRHPNKTSCTYIISN